MDKDLYEKLKKDFIFPEMKMTKGIMKEYVIGDDGKMYEIEREIELPIFEEEEE